MYHGSLNRRILALIGLAFSIVSGVCGNQAVMAQRTLTITVATDKKTYGPGAVIEITGQVLRAGQPEGNVTVVFELRNQTGTIASGFMMTNSTGEFSKVLQVAGAFIPGSYTVYVGVTVDNETATSSASFTVVPEFPSSPQLIVLVSLAVSILLLRQRKSMKRKLR